MNFQVAERRTIIAHGETVGPTNKMKQAQAGAAEWQFLTDLRDLPFDQANWFVIHIFKLILE